MVEQYKQQLDGIMQREISRGDFLKFMGVALLGLTGIVGVLRNLNESLQPQTANKNQSAGYGRSPYGR